MRNRYKGHNLNNLHLRFKRLINTTKYQTTKEIRISFRNENFRIHIYLRGLINVKLYSTLMFIINQIKS